MCTCPYNYNYLNLRVCVSPVILDTEYYFLITPNKKNSFHLCSLIVNVFSSWDQISLVLLSQVNFNKSIQHSIKLECPFSVFHFLTLTYCLLLSLIQGQFILHQDDPSTNGGENDLQMRQKLDTFETLCI